MRWILVVLFLVSSFVQAQNYKYVNTGSVPLYEYPDTSSQVYVFFHPPCKIEVKELTKTRYEKFPEILNNWYMVRFFINDGTRHGGRTYKGYIQRFGLVDSSKYITASSYDPGVTFSYTIPGDSIRHDLRFFKSTKGGCFYINSAGKKEYVNFCR
jgi:hypothetical protein